MSIHSTATCGRTISPMCGQTLFKLNPQTKRAEGVKAFGLWSVFSIVIFTVIERNPPEEGFSWTVIRAGALTNCVLSLPESHGEQQMMQFIVLH